MKNATNRFSQLIVDYSPHATAYDTEVSHLHKTKVVPIADGNRAERRAFKKKQKKKGR